MIFSTTVTPFAQQSDYSLTSDACQKCSVGIRRVDDSVFRHKNVRGSEFCDISEHVAYDCVIEAAGLCVEKSAELLG